MELTLIYTIVGFALAGWSVIANDSIQTLGTFIASKQKWFKWYTLASAASVAMIATISFGWWTYFLFPDRNSQRKTCWRKKPGTSTAGRNLHVTQPHGVCILQ